MPPSILIIEDEPAIADTLLYALSSDGFHPHWCATGREGREALERQAFALVILDVGLPDTNGFVLCQEIRRHSSVPILFLTARNNEIDRVAGLEMGGDDYVAKPFSPREVSARIRAILRRGPATAQAQDTANTERPSSNVKQPSEDKTQPSLANGCFSASPPPPPPPPLFHPISGRQAFASGLWWTIRVFRSVFWIRRWILPGLNFAF